MATALPTIVGELGGQEQLAWVVSATLLASTVSTPIWGKLSDLHGRKIMFQSAIRLFLVASLAAGFAQNMAQLIGARGIQGLGVGGLMALSQAIIGDVVSPRERGRYQGYIGSMFGLATVAGPLAGGFLVEHGSWRWTFWVGIPIGVVALLVTERALRFSFPCRRRAIDWLGAFFIVASGLLTVPLVAGLLITSIVSGRIITRTGRYKIFPVFGMFIAAVGLGLLSLLDVHTSLVITGAYMLVTGLGIGMFMQVLVLAAQNAVEHKDLGVATSGATFFRSMGGAAGVVLFGALLSHRPT